MVQESVKKTSSQFLSEPNDRNTWVTVKARIENFLTELWKKGACMGTTPREAFFVRVGLGETMSEHDIREGLMILEIGLAAVRPAEFIIIRMSQKMVGS